MRLRDCRASQLHRQHSRQQQDMSRGKPCRWCDVTAVLQTAMLLLLVSQSATEEGLSRTDASQAREGPPWSAGSFPLPSRDDKLCGHGSVIRTDFLCDPDLILTDAQADEVHLPTARPSNASEGRVTHNFC